MSNLENRSEACFAQGNDAQKGTHGHSVAEDSLSLSGGIEREPKGESPSPIVLQDKENAMKIKSVLETQPESDTGAAGQKNPIYLLCEPDLAAAEEIVEDIDDESKSTKDEDLKNTSMETEMTIDMLGAGGSASSATLALEDVLVSSKSQESRISNLHNDIVAVPISDALATPGTTSRTESRTVPFASGANKISTLEVIAPTDMLEGYKFYVDIDGKQSFFVSVPLGGVRQGQRFPAHVLGHDKAQLHRIPSGQWRDGLFDCCAVGCFHPVVCLAAFCTPCALGQVLARMKLDCCARAGTRDAFSPYSILFWLTAAVYVIVLDFLFILIEIALGKSSLDANERATDAMIIFLIVLGSLFLLFILSNTLRAREHMRKKYDIPASFPYEDACCAMLCNPCTVCQMARHSADYQRHLGACCTRNGLMETVPNPV